MNWKMGEYSASSPTGRLGST